MSRTSELGSSDTQVLHGNRLLSAHTIIHSSDERTTTPATSTICGRPSNSPRASP
jgi:hypothetical protein